MDFQDCSDSVETKLQKLLPSPWIAVQEEAGINILLLLRNEERTVQRRIFFSQCGAEKITVHCKPIPSSISELILKQDQCNSLASINEDRVSKLFEHIIAVVQRMQMFEVCVGVDNSEFMPFWSLNNCGKIDENPYNELRYKQTFRPFGCHLLVSTSGYLKRHCIFCTQTKARFRAKLARLKGNCLGLTTPNLYLDREQLLQKVLTQEKKLQSNRAQIAKLKADLQLVTSNRDFQRNDNLSEELIKICMKYVKKCK